MKIIISSKEKEILNENLLLFVAGYNKEKEMLIPVNLA